MEVTVTMTREAAEQLVFALGYGAGRCEDYATRAPADAPMVKAKAEDQARQLRFGENRMRLAMGDPKVICVYCQRLAVSVKEIGDDFWEGSCRNCGRSVDYDYDPRGIVGFEHGAPIR